MKNNKLIPLVVFAITVPALSGCYEKIDRKTFMEIFAAVDFNECHYYITDQTEDATWLTDFDGYMVNEFKKMNIVKRYTEPTNMDRWIDYDVYRYGSDGSINTQIKFYDSGAIVVNDYGSYIAESYSYFTISQEEATNLFKVTNDRFDYANQVRKEDLKATKEEKGIYQLIDSLKQQQSAPMSLDSRDYADNGMQLLSTLENIEYTYQETLEGYIPSRDIYLKYNAFAYEDGEKYPWYFVLGQNLRTVYVNNHIKMDRVGHENINYYNIYEIDYEAGRAIYSEARRISTRNQEI